MIGKLLGIRLRAIATTFGGRSKSGEYKPPSVGRILLVALVFFYLIGIFAFISTLLAINTLAATTLLGAPWMYFAIYALIPFAFVFMFSIFETKGELFECKDNALLLSLPLRPRDIVISRILTVLVLNYAEAAVFMLPFLIVYAIGGGTPLALVGGVLTYLLIPLLATALSVGVGYLIAKISARVKRKTLITMVLYLLFFAAYFSLYQTFFSASGDMGTEDMAAALAGLADALPILSFIGEAVMLSPLPIAVLTVVTVGVSALVFWRIVATFVGVSTEVRGAVKRTYVASRTAQGSAFAALCKKELSRFVSSATYMMNSAMGILLMLLLTGFLCFADRASLEATLAGLGVSLSQVTPVLIMALVTVALVNYPSACALSLEGKCLWQVRSLPVRAEVILFSKCMPHVLICSAATLVCGTALSIAMRASLLHTVAFLLLPILANAAAAMFGIFLNTAFPKLDYTNEAQPVKQSLSAMLAMLLQMVFGILLLLATLVLSLISLGWVALLGTALLLLLIGALMYVLITHVSVKKFQTLG